MSSSLINVLLVVGLLGGAVLAYMSRCSVFKICGPDPLQELYKQISGGGTSSGSSGIDDVLFPAGSPEEQKAIKEHGSPIDPDKTEKFLATRGQDSASVAAGITQQIKSAQTEAQKNIASGKTPVNSKCGPHSTCKPIFGQLMSVDAKGCVRGDCSTAAAYARANLAALTVNGWRMSYN